MQSTFRVKLINGVIIIDYEFKLYSKDEIEKSFKLAYFGKLNKLPYVGKYITKIRVNKFEQAMYEEIDVNIKESLKDYMLENFNILGNEKAKISMINQENYCCVSKDKINYKLIKHV